MFITEQTWRSGKLSDFYFGGDCFGSRPVH